MGKDESRDALTLADANEGLPTGLEEQPVPARLGLSQYEKVLINYLAVTKHSVFCRLQRME
jgi:hypothetical protein